MNSLKIKMMLIIVFVTVAALGAVSLINYNRVSYILDEQLSNVAANSAEYNAIVVNEWLQGIINEVNTMAENADVQSADPERCFSVLNQVLKNHDDYEDIFSADQQGNAVAALRKETFSLADREYFNQAIQGKTVIYGPDDK